MWSPNEIRKLVAQFAGITFGLGGIALMISGVKATGKINITTDLISGEIESGSAGLLLLFLSFFLIVIPSLKGSKFESSNQNISKPNETIQKNDENKKYLISSLVCLAVSLILFFSGEYLQDKKYSFGSFFIICGGALGLITGFLFLSTIYNYLFSEEIKEEDDKKSKSIK